MSTPHREQSVLHKRARDLLVESCLALANFKCAQVCLRLHSRGTYFEFMALEGKSRGSLRGYFVRVSFGGRMLLQFSRDLEFEVRT